ncbi:MAG: hypothetical protein AB7H77_05805 [Bdellovibrionales bacterium]
MRKHTKTLYAALLLATSFFVSAPGRAQSIHNLVIGQPSISTTRVVHSEGLPLPQPTPASTAAPESTVTPAEPAATEQAAPVKKKKAETKKAKNKKKKKAHAKTSSAAKKHKKHASHKDGAKKKKKSAAITSQGKVARGESGKASVKSTKTAKRKAKPPSDGSMAVISGATYAPGRKDTATGNTSAAGSKKSVAYSFCLGYDNCVPHRYEAANGKTPATVIRQGANGNWEEVKLHPVVMSDLAKLAAGETSGHVDRPLTAQEKAHIAHNQGKMHALLIGNLKSGTPNKEEIKTALRQMNIQSVAELNDYDPKLGRHEVALQAVNEISVGH